MITLQRYLTEALMSEGFNPSTYKAQYSPAEWEKVLKHFKPETSEASNLCDLENYANRVRYGHIGEEIQEWFNRMYKCGVANTPENHDVLRDILYWVIQNYQILKYGKRDENVLGWAERMKDEKYIWGVVEKSKVAISIPKNAPLTGDDEKYGTLLASIGNDPEVQKLADKIAEKKNKT